MTKKEKAIAQAERDRAMDEKLSAEFSDPQKRARRRRNVRRGWCITLALLLLVSAINWGVITGMGNISIDRIKLSGNDGAEFSGLVYRPQNATDATPAPTIIMFHGNAGNARNHESQAMEFARRGFVVVTPDLYGSGDSQGYFDGTITDKSFGAATSPRGLLDEADLFFQYAYTLPYVDTNNIIASGHSMGCNAATMLGAKYGAQTVILESPVILLRGENNPYAEEWSNYRGNYVSLVGDVEVGGPMPIQDPLPILHNVPGCENVTEVEEGKVYGSFEEGNGFVYIVENQRIHEAAFVNSQTIGNMLKYGQLVVGDAVPNYIDSSDQVWMYKDYIGLLGIFVWVAFVMATALLAIEEIPAFASVRRPLARNVGFRGKSLVVATIVGLLVPYLVIKTDAFGIVGGGKYVHLWACGFNLGFSNMGFGVVIGLALVCVIGSLVFILSERKKKALKPCDFGITPVGYSEKSTTGEKAKAIAGMVGKSTLVAALAVGVGFAYMQLQSSVLGTDFYAWFFGVKDLPLVKIPYYINYLVVFILCFVVLSIDMNIIRRLPTTGSETKDLIIAMAVNVVVGIAMVILIVVVKWHLQSIGSPADTNWLWGMGLDTQRIWGLPVGMTVATAASTFIYKKTGNLWLCALLVGTVACLMGILYGSTRFHYLTYFCG